MVEIFILSIRLPSTFIVAQMTIKASVLSPCEILLLQEKNASKLKANAIKDRTNEYPFISFIY